MAFAASLSIPADGTWSAMRAKTSTPPLLS